MHESQSTRRSDPARRRAIRQARTARNMREHGLALCVLSLAILLFFGIASIAARDREFSDTENRSLAQMPELTWASLLDGSWFSGVTDAWADQFFARDGWMSLQLRWSRLTGSRESGDVFLCDDDYLIAKPAEADRTVLSENEAAIDRFSGVYSDVSMLLLVIPEASQIIRQYLPKNAPVYDQLSVIEGISLCDRVTILDGISPLEAHAAEEIYYHTDHHWTSLGAYTVFCANAEGLGIDPGNVTYGCYTVTDSFEGTLSSKSGSHTYLDSIQVYLPENTDLLYYVTYNGSGERVSSIFDSSCLEAKDKYTVFFGGNHPLVEIRTTADNGRNLLIFKDSYANSFVQFLLPYYENIVMIDPRYYYDNVEAVMNSKGITDVLFLYSADTFTTDSSLADVLG